MLQFTTGTVRWWVSAQLRNISTKKHVEQYGNSHVPQLEVDIEGLLGNEKNNSTMDHMNHIVPFNNYSFPGIQIQTSFKMHQTTLFLVSCIIEHSTAHRKLLGSKSIICVKGSLSLHWKKTGDFFVRNRVKNVKLNLFRLVIL